MKNSLVTAAVVLCALAAGGCASRSDGRMVNTRQPGPAIGTGVGVAAGAGFVGAAGTAFDGDRRVVRSWRTETTSDGRTIRVPVEIEVDKYGRPYESAPRDSGADAQRGPRR